MLQLPDLSVCTTRPVLRIRGNKLELRDLLIILTKRRDIMRQLVLRTFTKEVGISQIFELESHNRILNLGFRSSHER